VAVGRPADVLAAERGVVIDRDYLTSPEDDIKEITPVMTIVGGRVSYSR
jgi:predicted amidohydrolase YtcJ